MYAMHYSNYHQKVRHERERDSQSQRERERERETCCCVVVFSRRHLCQDMAQVDIKFIKIKIKQKCVFEIEVESLHKLCTHTHTSSTTILPPSILPFCALLLGTAAGLAKNLTEWAAWLDLWQCQVFDTFEVRIAANSVLLFVGSDRCFC